MTASEFLQIVYGKVRGDLSACISYFALPSRNTVFAGVADADGFVRECVERRENSYFAVSLMREGITSGRGRAEDAVAIPGFWSDLDFKNGIDEAKALDILCQCPEPTLIVATGHGWHVYWLFEEVWELPTALENARAQLASKAFATAVDRVVAQVAGSAAASAELDKVADLARVLRLPGSRNFKRGLSDEDVVIHDADGPRSDRAVLMTWAGSMPTAQVVVAAPVVPKTSTPATNVPIDLLDLKKSLRASKQAAKVRRYLDGDPLPADGRNRELTSIIQSITNVLPSPDKTDPVAVAGLLIACIEATAKADAQPGKPPPTFDQAVAMAESALRSTIEHRAKEAAEKKAFLEAAERKAAAYTATLIAALPPDKLYTEVDRARFSKEQNCSEDEFIKNRLIIQKRDSYHVFFGGDYLPPVSESELLTLLKRAWEPMLGWSVRTWRFTQKDERRAMSVSEIMHGIDGTGGHGTVAETVVGELGLARSFFDGRIFHEAHGRLRPIDPKFDPVIDKWLRLLGGTRAELLLDWIATITRLDRQNSALYLTGKAGTGKTTLTNGLARLWIDGGPPNVATAVGKFNSALRTCPLVAGDEKTRCEITDLMSLIGNNSRPLTQKYVDDGVQKGAVRVILSDNEGNSLTGDELSPDLIESLEEKILTIHVDGKAKEYFAELGGESGTGDWIGTGRIAAHALWLRDNRSVISKGRFLVGGIPGDMSYLASRSKQSILISEWLWSFCRETDRSKGYESTIRQSGLAVIGNSKLLVNVDAIANNWEGYITSQKLPPSKKLIGNTLKNLSRGEVVKHNKTFWDIDIDKVGHHVAAFLGGEIMIKSNIDRVELVAVPPPKPPTRLRLVDRMAQKAQTGDVKV